MKNEKPFIKLAIPESSDLFSIEAQQILNQSMDEKNIEKILQFLDNINEFLI